MCKKIVYLVSFVLVLALAGNASAIGWTNADGNDILWSNGNNWQGGLVPSGVAVYMSTATGDCLLNYAAPTILNMMGPGGGSLNPGGIQTMTIDGGSLTSTSYLSIGHGSGGLADGRGVVDMINGASLYAGADLHIGGHGDGMLNVSGNSTAYSPGAMKMAYGSSMQARVNLGLGTIDVNDLFTAQYKDVNIDITEGTLIVRAQSTEPGSGTIDEWIGAGYITAYGGNGTLIRTVDGNGYDVLTAIPEPATIALLSLGGLALIRRKR
jgi:hypothetical protein